jgi:hypothetical protein
MDLDELLKREDEAWSGLVDAFAGISDERREEPGVVPGWSVKDLVWHCGYWARYVGDVLHRMDAGTPEPEDVDWDALNASVAEESKLMTWDEVITGAEGGRMHARSALQAMSELTDKAAEEFSDETFDHYDEHRAEIAAFGA